MNTNIIKCTQNTIFLFKSVLSILNSLLKTSISALRYSLYEALMKKKNFHPFIKDERLKGFKVELQNVKQININK